MTPKLAGAIITRPRSSRCGRTPLRWYSRKKWRIGRRWSAAPFLARWNISHDARVGRDQLYVGLGSAWERVVLVRAAFRESV